MTDRELLKLAAKATGITVHGLADKYVAQHTLGKDALCVANDRGGDSLWNPLTDDGDALRLAVKLRLQIQINDLSIVIYRPQRETGVTPPECYEYPDSIQGDDYEIQHVNHDKATRRAIVRAAAEIGKEMP